MLPVFFILRTEQTTIFVHLKKVFLLTVKYLAHT